MPSSFLITITPIYAALIAAVFILLSARVITYRRAHSLTLGDGGDPALLTRMRAQANCAEYAPLGLLLLLLLELQGAPMLALHLLGLMLLIGRIAHAVGFSDRNPNIGLRILGIALTLTMLGLSALGLIVMTLV